VIGKEFGHGEDKNTAAQLVPHAILGATLAYIMVVTQQQEDAQRLVVKQQPYI
jgi:hypothetical protein